MNPLGLILLFGNLLIAPAIIMLVRSTRGLVFSVVVGWVILSPRAGINLPGIPRFTKDFAVAYGVLIGVLLFRGDLIRRFKPRKIDVLLLMCLFGPFISSMMNGLGPWDATSELYGRVMVWGVPYLLGRVLVRNLDDVKDCALAVLLAGMVLVPFCLIEIRLSPQIHRWVYGTHPAPFHMAKRLGGYRPMLSFRHGIEVGTWLACSGAIGFWFSLVATRERMLWMPVRACTTILLIVNFMCRSLGSLVLLAGSIGVAIFSRSSRTKFALLLLTLATPTYLFLRITDVWSPDMLVNFVAQNIDESRASSFAARIHQEQVLGEKAKDRILFGWGGHNRFRVFDDFGQQTTVVDALWIITFGKYGLFGTIGLYGMLCVPSILIVRRTPARLLLHPMMAGVVGLILAVAIANGDSLQNAFYSPVMMIAAGVLATTSFSLRSWLSSQASSPPAARTAVQSPAITHRPQRSRAHETPGSPEHH